MTTGSISYLAFLAALVVAFHLHAGRFWRETLILGGGLALLLSQATTLTPLIPTLLFVLTGFGFAVLAGRLQGGMALRAGLSVVLIAIFLVLKQYWFAPTIPALALFVTIGMSYMLLRAIHVILEAGDGFDVGPADFGLYLRYQLNPFTFLAGPINRFDEFGDDDRRLGDVRLDLDTVAAVLLRVSFGLIKLMVLAPLATYYQVNLPTQFGALGLAPAAALFILYVYWNFSGAMDVVIAAARLFGYTLPENFDRPWMASSFIDFWSRWHITLSNFLRDTVFFPMLKLIASSGAGRGGLIVGNMVGGFFAFIIMGLWHGNAYMFLWLGVLLALGVTVNRLWDLVAPEAGDGLLGAAREHLSGAWAWLYFGIAAMTVWPNVPSLAAYGKLLAQLASLSGLAGMALTMLALIGWRLATQGLDRLPALPAPARQALRQVVIAVNAVIVFLLFRHLYQDISTFNYYANIT